MDTSKLKPANENPWYLMMTLHGEQEDGKFSKDVHDENRQTWNAFMLRGHAAIGGRARKAGWSLPSFDRWREISQAVLENLESEFVRRNGVGELPNSISNFDGPCDLSKTFFENPLHLSGFFLPNGLILDHSHIQKGMRANTAFFGGRLSLIDARIEGEFSCDCSWFEDGLVLRKSTLIGGLSIAEAKIEGEVGFQNLQVEDGLKCKSTKVHGEVNGEEMVIKGDATFEEAIFAHKVDFRDTLFQNRANFQKAHFGADLTLDGACVNGRLSFLETRFDGVALMKGRSGFIKDKKAAHFGTKAIFSAAHFKKRADFYQRRFGPLEVSKKRATVLTFANAVFDAPVSFEEAVFPHLMPVLSNTTLPVSTRVTAKEEHWPAIHIGWRQGRTPNEQTAGFAKESAAALRHAMNRQSLPEEEHFFFTREMHHAGRIGGWIERLPYRLYGWLSGYGGSIDRPAWGLVWLFIAPLGMYFAALGPASLGTFAKALALSFSSIFKFFGFQRLYFGETIQDLEPVVQVTTATQTVLGFILLFFLGLGLRTRFRLR